MTDGHQVQRLRLVRWLMMSLLATLAGAAGIGLWAILVGDLNDFWLKVFLSSLLTSGYSILGLGCAVPFDRDLWKRWATLGIVVTLVAYGLVLRLIFVEPSWSDGLPRWPGFLTIWSIAFSHTSLLTIARLAPRHRLVRTVTNGLVIAVATLLSLLIFSDFTLVHENGWWRALAALSLLAAMGTLAVPILHRMSGLAPEAPRAVESIDKIELYCPRCHQRQVLSLGTAACGRCGLRIAVTLPADR